MRSYGRANQSAYGLNYQYWRQVYLVVCCMHAKHGYWQMVAASFLLIVEYLDSYIFSWTLQPQDISAPRHSCTNLQCWSVLRAVWHCIGAEVSYGQFFRHWFVWHTLALQHKKWVWRMLYEFCIKKRILAFSRTFWLSCIGLG